MPEPKQPRGGAALSAMAAAGIFVSRIAGLVRQRVFAHYLGSSPAAAAFAAALRIPNFLQNLFGEGALSASFIPVYAALIGRGEREQADRVAGAVFGILALALAVLCALGLLASPLLVEAIAPGFDGELRALTVTLVRILFPGIALLVLSAWCLGILNSHERVFLPYAAPVLWNGAIIGALLLFGPGSGQAELAVQVAWGAVIGSALQLLVQLPAVLALLGRFRPSLSLAPAREVLASFSVVVVGRGVVQLSAYLDTAFASLVSARALAVLSYAQAIYLLPVSLFSTAAVAAELPALSRAADASDHAALRDRLSRGLSRMAFFVVPSAAALLLLGDVVAGALLEGGRFGAGDTRYAWYVLMGSAVGLSAQTQGRLYANAFYALRAPRTPLRFAVVRLVLTAILAWLSVARLPLWLGVPRELAAAFITATTGVAAWIEYALLRRALAARLGGDAALPAGRSARLWLAAGLAALAALGLKALLASRFGARVSAEWGAALLPMPRLHPVLTAAIVLPAFGGLYLALAALLGVPQIGDLLRRGLRRR